MAPAEQVAGFDEQRAIPYQRSVALDWDTAAHDAEAITSWIIGPIKQKLERRTVLRHQMYEKSVGLVVEWLRQAKISFPAAVSIIRYLQPPDLKLLGNYDMVSAVSCICDNDEVSYQDWHRFHRGLANKNHPYADDFLLGMAGPRCLLQSVPNNKTDVVIWRLGGIDKAVGRLNQRRGPRDNGPQNEIETTGPPATRHQVETSPADVTTTDPQLQHMSGIRQGSRQSGGCYDLVYESGQYS